MTTSTTNLPEQTTTRTLAFARGARPFDLAVRVFVFSCGAIVLVMTVVMLGFLAKTGIRGMREVGLMNLLVGAIWKPEAGEFGGRALIFGTLVSALGAVVLGATPAVLAAVWLTEFAPKSIARLYRRLMETAAAVPSVVYGWLALVNLVPSMDRFARRLYGDDAAVGGEGLASSAVLLGIMIAPTVLLLSLDSLARVPKSLRDASAALGASPWQTAFRVILPSSWRGILVAVFFGLARAAGETMAVQMVIGGARQVPSNAFTATTTISTQIVMDMQNARPDTPASNALFSMSLILLVLSTGVVLITRALSKRTAQ